jgi:hypothetical protein
MEEIVEHNNNAERTTTNFSLETLERYTWKNTTFLSYDDDDYYDDTSNMSQNTKRSTNNYITTKIESSSGGIQTYVFTIVHLGSDVATTHPCLYHFSLFYSALSTTETLTFEKLIGARAALQLQL